MKISAVPTLIAIAICVLLAYALYTICHAEEQQLLLAIGGFVCLSLTMATALGVRFKQSRTSANLAVLAMDVLLLTAGQPRNIRLCSVCHPCLRNRQWHPPAGFPRHNLCHCRGEAVGRSPMICLQ